MKNIVLAAVAAFSLTGIAAAQEAPQLQGNYDAAVLDSYQNVSEDRADVVGVRAVSIVRDASLAGHGPVVSDFDIHSGR